MEASHSLDSGPVEVYCELYQSGVWTRMLSVPASVTTGAAGARYSATVALPYAGRWRMQVGDADAGLSAYSTGVAVRVTPDAPVWNRDGVLTIAERMRNRLNATQLIVATGSALGSRYGALRFFEYRNGDWVQLMAVPCRFGRNGLTNGLARHAGSLTTPTGIWLMPSYVFGQHTTAPVGTRMPYRHIGRRSYWSAEKGAAYNTWVESSRPVYGEHLIDYSVAYEWAVSSGYNSPPNERVFGRGTAIFLHCFRGTHLTAGCISVSAYDMARVFRRLDPAKRRAFAVGTTRTGTSTSIYAY
jgi:L,D-peptidoglycan transpeptidase YkuD (ErfK/YbiS/YcfS/YnhG family)